MEEDTFMGNWPTLAKIFCLCLPSHRVGSVVVKTLSTPQFHVAHLQQSSEYLLRIKMLRLHDLQ